MPKRKETLKAQIEKIIMTEIIVFAIAPKPHLYLYMEIGITKYILTNTSCVLPESGEKCKWMEN